MSYIFKIFLVVLAFTGKFIEVYSESEDDVENLIMGELERVIRDGVVNGFDPLRIAYLPLPLTKMNPIKSVDGFMIIENLELRGLSTVKWNLTYNATKMIANLELNVPILKLHVESCMLEVKMTEKSLGLNSVKSQVTEMSGQGELTSTVENFKVSIEVKLEEKRKRLRISDLVFNINLDWCDLHWDIFIVDGETVMDWDEICEDIMLGIELLNEDSVAPYIEEILMSAFNIVLLTMETSSFNVPELVSELGGKLVY